MDTRDLLRQADFLFKIALSKTHDVGEAQDLVQETYLQALVAIAKGAVIEKPRAYLSSILNNQFFLELRKRYKIRTVSYDALPLELPDDHDDYEQIFETDDGQLVRRELAFLSYIYRETMVRYYMQNQSIAEISRALSIPPGTVLSRLDAGRKKIKKGVETMESFQKNSYQPEILHIGINGRTGLNNEPFSCIKNSLDQNLLILAYDKPKSTEDLSQALGVPMTFIEESVEQLVKCELLRRDGGKVYTDFVIASAEDDRKSVEISKQFAKDFFDDANQAFQGMVREYKNIDGFAACEDTYLYILAVMSCRNNFSGRISDVVSGHTMDDYKDFPDRPNYGKWIVFGSRYPHGYDFQDGNARYSVSGRSTTGAISDGIVNVCEWDTPIGRTHGAHFKYELKESERALAIDAIRAGQVNAFQAELVPDLERQGFIKQVDGRKIPAIPYIKPADEKQFFAIESKGSDEWCNRLLDKAVKFARDNVVAYPKRIKHVIGAVYNLSLIYLPMAYIYEASERGVIKLGENKCYPIMYIVTK